MIFFSFVSESILPQVEVQAIPRFSQEIKKTGAGGAPVWVESGLS
jgi:hypothetical protein